MKFIILFLFIFLNSLPVFAKCIDADKIYKVCSDQAQRFEQALAVAKKSNRWLLVKFGFESCPWCQLLHERFHSEPLKKQMDDSIVLIEVGVYDNSGIEITGQEVLDRIDTMEEGKTLNPEGYPYMALVDPQSEKAISFSAQFFGNGYESKNILSVISKAKVILAR